MRRSTLVPVLTAVPIVLPSAARGAAWEVVVYTSVDQICSERVPKDYEKKTGVSVKAVFEVEASKTTGLVNCLIAEKNWPKCHVFWYSKIGKTIALKQKGVLMPYRWPSAKDISGFLFDRENCWTGFAARARGLAQIRRPCSWTSFSALDVILKEDMEGLIAELKSQL